MKKILLFFMILGMSISLFSCTSKISKINREDNSLFYDGNEYIILDHSLGIRYNGYSRLTKIGWTNGPYFSKEDVFAFYDDSDKNFIYYQFGTSQQIGIKKDYNMLSVFDSHFNKVVGSGSSQMILDPVIKVSELIDFETNVERTSSFTNSYLYSVSLQLVEYPFLKYVFSIFLVDGKYIMDVLDHNNNQTFYPIQEDYYYLFQK